VAIKRRWKKRPQIGLDTMFETRTDEWSAAGLQLEVDSQEVRRARRRLYVLSMLLVAVVVGHVEVVHHFDLLRDYPLERANAHSLGVRFTKLPPEHWAIGEVPLRIVAVLAILVLGWLISIDAGRVSPALFKRMDPATAGTVGFVIRLFLVIATALGALGVAGISFRALAVGGAFTAVIVGLAAQQTLGNVFAGMVLLSARPFRLGERIRLQAGAVGGSTEGIVSSLGLLYTTLARGEDRILVPNNVVLAAAIVPLREPEAVDVKVRLSAGIRPSHVQQILDANVKTETRSAPQVVLEEIDGDEVVVRVRATPDRRSEGAKLADEIIVALSSVTGEHPLSTVTGEHQGHDSGDAARR
jgi:small conductance mechanosensitive channel